jgi:hypothetical protein
MCITSPHPAAFAIGGVVRYRAGEGVIDQAAGTGDKGLASLGGQSCPVAPSPELAGRAGP